MVILGMVHDRLNPTFARYSQHWQSVLFQACERSSEWSQVLMLCYKFSMFMAKYGKLKACGCTCLFFLLGFKMCLFSVGICKSHISEKSCWYRHRQSAIDLLLILWGEPVHYFRCSSQSFHVGPSSPKASSFRETSRWFDLLWSDMFFRTKFLYNCDHLQNFIDFKIRHSGLVSGVFEQKDLDSHFSKKIQPEINQQKLFFTSYPVAMQIPYIKNG